MRLAPIHNFVPFTVERLVKIRQNREAMWERQVAGHVAKTRKRILVDKPQRKSRKNTKHTSPSLSNLPLDLQATIQAVLNGG